jgi:hypothetical protein
LEDFGWFNPHDHSRAQAGPSKPARRASNSSSISASSLIDDLDEAAEKDDFDWKGLRERRLEALKAEVKRNEASKDDRHGRLTEVTNEKELISTSAWVASGAQEQVISFPVNHADLRRVRHVVI